MRLTKMNITVRVDAFVLDSFDIPELTARAIRLRIIEVRIKMVSVRVF
jgi:hypothetical protein